MFTTNDRKLAQLIAEPPTITDNKGNAFIFIEADQVLPNEAMPNGAVPFRYRSPAEEGAQGRVFEFTFKNPPERRFSFGFTIGAALK